MAPVTSWDEHGNPIQAAAPAATSWDEHGNPISAVTPQNDHAFTGDTSGFRPDDPDAGVGGFFRHIWNNISPASAVRSVGAMLQRPVQTYLNDEQSRAADLKNAGNRASKIVHSDASLPGKAMGLLDTGAQAAADFVPFVGTAANHAADEVNSGHVGAGLGDAAGLGIALSAPHIIKAAPDLAGAAVDGTVGAGGRVANAARSVKNAVTVSPELKATAASTPADADVALASRKVGDIQTAAKAPLQQQVGSHFEEMAAQAPDTPADATQVTGLGNKAKVASDAWKASGRSIYQKLDQAAKAATGSDGGFQQIGDTIDALKEEIHDPKVPEVRRAEAAKSLVEAQAQQEEFIRQAEARGVPNVRAAIGEANKRYSTGLSIAEVGRRFGLQETQLPGPDGAPVSHLTGGGNAPLQAPLRAVADPIQPRGHVLKQALGEDRASQIQQSVANASKQIADGKAATSAAKTRVQQAKEAAAAAQQRVKTIRGRQAKIVGAGASLLGAKVLYDKSKGVASALHGDR